MMIQAYVPPPLYGIANISYSAALASCLTVEKIMQTGGYQWYLNYSLSLYKLKIFDMKNKLLIYITHETFLSLL